MFKSDLVLLHAPSVYDFRKRTVMFGPISDLIPSTPVFEMYPIGFISIAEYLERAGYRVRIVNLAYRMLNDSRFDAESLIRDIGAGVFGIDLHWLPHAQGAIEVARLVKKHHPTSRVVMGGLSASYYYRELFNYPEVDFVIRGDSTEEPLRQLLDCLRQGKPPESVPNLVWRDASGEVRENEFSYVPANLDGLMTHSYNYIARSVARHRDLANYIPFKRWLRYPIMAVLTCRGCTRNCAFCGGSAFSFRNICHRSAPAFRSPEAVAEDVRQARRLSRGPVFILGDIRQPGEDYAERLLHLLAKEKPTNQVIMELFTPAPKEFIRKMAEACPGFCLEISPESHDPEVRNAIGKSYSNQALEKTIEEALAAGCQRADIFFLIGLPRQTRQSVMATVDYCNRLLSRKGVAPFISPLVPFLDPGCLIFEHPDRYGYQRFCHSLEDHRRALESPSWKHMLSFQTKWLSRDDIASVTYESSLELNRLKARHGFVGEDVAQATERRIQAAIATLRAIDDLMARGDWSEQELSRLKAAVDRVNDSTLCQKTELELPTGLMKLNLPRALWSFLVGR